MHSWDGCSGESAATPMPSLDGELAMLVDSAEEAAADPDEKRWFARQARQKKAQKLYRRALHTTLLMSYLWSCGASRRLEGCDASHCRRAFASPACDFDLESDPDPDPGPWPVRAMNTADLAWGADMQALPCLKLTVAARFAWHRFGRAIALVLTATAPPVRRQKQKERLSEMEDEVEKLAQQSKGTRIERAALLERNTKLRVRLTVHWCRHLKAD